MIKIGITDSDISGSVGGQVTEGTDPTFVDEGWDGKN